MLKSLIVFKHVPSDLNLLRIKSSDNIRVTSQENLSLGFATR